MASSLIQEIDSGVFSSIIKDGNIKILKFWAPWCGPCKTMNPVVESVAAKHEKVKFYAVNIDNDSCRALAEKYGVASIPTMVAIDGEGNTVATKVGSMLQTALEAWVSELAESK
jgi:thioredoxin 1